MKLFRGLFLCSSGNQIGGLFDVFLWSPFFKLPAGKMRKRKILKLFVFPMLYIESVCLRIINDFARMICLQFWIETDKAAYLLRQYFFNNLHDRLSTRPFLSLIEKKWLAFQVILSINILNSQHVSYPPFSYSRDSIFCLWDSCTSFSLLTFCIKYVNS